MRHLKSTVCLSLCLTMSSVLAAEKDASELCTSADRSQITDSIAEYAHRWDAKDAAGVAALFAEDGRLDVWNAGEQLEGAPIVGRDRIYDYAVAAHTVRLAGKQSRHHFSSIRFVELEEQTATTEHIAMVTHQVAGEKPVLTMTGTYRIAWTKTADGWLIAERVLFIDR
ncbi:MAG: nuclear transport factor 2 family protein [Pseudomonadota bacterium]